MVVMSHDHVSTCRPADENGFVGLAEVFPSGAWSIYRRMTYRPNWLRQYAEYQRRSVGSRVFLFRPERTLEEVWNILCRWMRRAGIEPADTLRR